MRTKAFRHTPLFTALACALISPAALAVVVDPLQVTLVDDDPLAQNIGTLAYAINYANTHCDVTTGNPAPAITFAIPGTGPFVIAPSTGLPQFACTSPNAYNPTIDGSTQPGYVPNTSGGFNSQIMIVIDGTGNNGSSSCALGWGDNGYGGSLAVRGLAVQNWTFGGSESNQAAICGPVFVNGNRITGNTLGVLGFGQSYIGSSAAADRNVIAGNAVYGITLASGTHSIANNLIGLDDSGGTLVAAPNQYGIHADCCFQSGAIALNVIVSSFSGVDIEEDNGFSINQNIFGGDPSGTNLLGAGSFGVSLHFAYGSSIIDNVFLGQGTGIFNNQGDNVLIQGNNIGTDASGTVAIGGSIGILDNLSYGTVIDSNLISGNDVGIHFTDTDSATVSNSRIGTNASGTAAIPNNFGVWADCGSNLNFSDNVIGGNRNAGMQLSAIQGSVLSNNTVGGAVPNGGAGIELGPLTCGGSPQRAVAKAAGGAKSVAFPGGNNESDGNQIVDSVISNNSGHGLWIVGGNNNVTFDNQIFSNTGDGVRIDSHSDSYGGMISPAVGNSLMLNRAYGNGGKNLNLGFDGGPLPNDPLDSDANIPNNGQNRPVIASVTRDTLKNQTTFAFSLDSKAGDYQIYFYSNPGPGAPAGQSYVGSTLISLAADGATSGSYPFPSVTVDNISATATRVGPEKPVIQDSSEYSDEVAATALPVPGVSVIPASIDFGDVVVGRSVGPAAITIGSVGTGDYTISALRDGSCTGPAICSTGSFICSTSCVEASPYRPGTTCTVNASFAPTSLGPQSRSLALCDDAAGSPRTITFTGNGISTPVVDISIAPLFWSFGQVLVGLTSGPQSFTVSNLSASQIYLATARTTGDFNILGGNCGATLAGNSTCSVDAVFAPLASGGVNGTLEVTGSDQPIPAALRAKGAKVTGPTTNTVIARLQGSGVQFGDLRLPATMNFGALLLHSAPGHQSLTLTNTGNGTLTISNISVSGPFTLTNGCGSTLAAGASCTVTLDFNPSALGTFNGSLTVISDAPGGSRSIALSANVVADARPVVRVNATAMGFGQRIIGSDSPAQRLTITNEGAAPASLTGVTFTQPEASGRAEFSLGGTSCGVTLAPQASCTADVVFKALGFGSRQGELQVPSNSSDSPARVQLGGTGCRPLTPDIIRTGRDPCAP